MPARTRLRYGCSTPTAVSVGSPQLHTAHARAERTCIVVAAAAASTNVAAAARLRTAVAFRLGDVAVLRRSVVGHHLADVAFGGAAVGGAVGARLVALAGRDHAGARAHRARRAIAVLVAVGLAVAVRMIEVAEELAGAALARRRARAADRLVLLVGVVVAARDEREREHEGEGAHSDSWLELGVRSWESRKRSDQG